MKQLLLLTFLLASAVYGRAQASELGLFFGAVNYSGELSRSFVDFDQTNPGVGGFLRVYPGKRANWRFHLMTGQITGSDANRTDEDVLRVRNLSFRSQLLELGVMLEWNLFSLNNYDSRVTPYFMLGVAGLYHAPEALYNGQWYDLQSLRTEGQGTPAFPDRPVYSKWQATFPAGIGIKSFIGDFLGVGFEAGARYTLTDYLDDVSTTYVDPSYLIEQGGERGILAAELANRTGEYLEGDPLPLAGEPRGDDSDTDLYFFAGITVSIFLGSKIRSGDGCPTNF